MPFFLLSPLGALNFLCSTIPPLQHLSNFIFPYFAWTFSAFGHNIAFLSEVRAKVVSELDLGTQTAKSMLSEEVAEKMTENGLQDA